MIAGVTHFSTCYTGGGSVRKGWRLEKGGGQVGEGGGGRGREEKGGEGRGR